MGYVVAKHALYSTLSNFDSKFTLQGLHILHLRNLNVDERTICI